MTNHMLAAPIALIARTDSPRSAISTPSTGLDDDAAPRFSWTDFIVGLAVVLAACIVAVIGGSFLWR